MADLQELGERTMGGTEGLGGTGLHGHLREEKSAQARGLRGLETECVENATEGGRGTEVGQVHAC